MRSFDDIFALAAQHKGGPAALDALLPKPKKPAALARIGDDRWLADMTKRVFQAGFNWSVIEKKWPGFEAAFEGFQPGRWSLLSDEDVERLVKDTRIVRHETKIRAIAANANLIRELAAEHGSAGKAFGRWPAEDFVSLLDLLKKRGARLGGHTGQYYLRGMGVDSFITTRDVTAALIREGVVEQEPKSKRDLLKTQEAFNTWMSESGRSLTEISRTLAASVG